MALVSGYFLQGKNLAFYMYRFKGRVRRVTFGTYPQMSVAEAHAAFGKALTSLDKGIDPGITVVNLNKDNRVSPTIKELATEYMEKWAKPRKRSWQEDERILKKDVTPYLGNCRVIEISRKDVITLLDKILERGAPIVANRTLAVIRRMFNFAVERDVITISPCYGIKAPAKENKRDRILTADEIHSFWHSLNDANMSELSKLALKLQLVTAQHKGEIVSAEWEEFDLTNGYWTIPSNKSKNGNAHVVPLSKLAVEILQQIKLASNNPANEQKWLFPSPTSNTHFRPEAINHVVRLNKFQSVKQFTPHDLRRTAASYMTAIGIPRLVVSKILNHVENSVTAIYDRHSYDTEKKDALEKWGNKLREIVK